MPSVTKVNGESGPAHSCGAEWVSTKYLASLPPGGLPPPAAGDVEHPPADDSRADRAHDLLEHAAVDVERGEPPAFAVVAPRAGARGAVGLAGGQVKPGHRLPP